MNKEKLKQVQAAFYRISHGKAIRGSLIGEREDHHIMADYFEHNRKLTESSKKVLLFLEHISKLKPGGISEKDTKEANELYEEIFKIIN